MTKKLSITIFIFLISLCIYSNKLVSGTVVDCKTNLPIPGAEIIINNQEPKFTNFDESIKHNLNYANRLKKFLEKYNIFSNAVSANFLLLNFDACKYSANFLYQKLKNKGIILRSTEDGYYIKNKLRLTIGSSRENLIFMNTVRKIFN